MQDFALEQEKVCRNPIVHKKIFEIIAYDKKVLAYAYGVTYLNGNNDA